MSKFKKGDKVRCIGESSRPYNGSNPHYGGAGWEKDKVFIIREIVGNICWPKAGDGGVFDHHLKLELNDWDE